MTRPGRPFPYRLARDEGHPALGLIVLHVDETVEGDFRRLLPLDRLAFHVTRIPSGQELTPATIAGMEEALPRAAALLPPAKVFDAVGYACTSASTQLGAARVEALIRQGAQARHVTNPFTAALAAFERLGVRRIAIVSPYIAEVSARLASAFRGAGMQVAESVAFGEAVEANVARISPGSVARAALSAGTREDVEAVFLSCTNLPTLAVIGEVEAALGKPVVSSNQALAWHMAALAGTGLAPDATGRSATA